MQRIHIDYKNAKCMVPPFESMDSVSSYPFNPNDMQAYLEGTKPVPNVGQSVQEFNGIDAKDVSYYARDTFEAIEAIKTCQRIEKENTPNPKVKSEA